MSAPLLGVHDLHLRIQDPASGEVREVLHGVDFDIAEAEALALVGESGSGKSLTARSIIRLMPPGSDLTGAIHFRGEPVLAMQPHRLQSYRAADVSMIFQDPRAHIDATHSIGDYLTESLIRTRSVPRREAVSRARVLLDEVRIDRVDHRLRQYPHELSGGMLQRVMIAAALTADPALLLADEPTTALDVTVQAEVVRILRELQRQRSLAMLFITHDLDLAEVTCDRTAVMYAGSVVEIQPSGEITAVARHPYSIALSRSRPRFAARAGRLAQLSGRPVAAHEAEPGCSFAPRCPLAADKCRAQIPPKMPAGPGSVACFRAGESRSLLLPRGQGDAHAAEQAADGSGDVVLAVEGLRRVFRAHRQLSRRNAAETVAVDDVSFTVQRGESLAIVGESGSGKTTVARMLVGLETPTAGIIRLDGHVRTGPGAEKLSRRARAHLAQIVFQDPYASLDPRQRVRASIGEVLRFGSAASGQQLADAVAALMDRVGLDPGLAERFPRRLSGGQRQRVAIARALAARPKVLVLDEAVASLDVSIQAQILNLLTDLRTELDITYVFITHDLSVVRQIADTVLVMHHGQVLERGAASEVLDNPRYPYTQRLIASIPSQMAGLHDQVGVVAPESGLGLVP